MPVAKPLGLRLYLEGEEVPVIAANVNIGLNSPSTASIQVIPIDELMELRPRTMVHLFFLDSDVSIKTDDESQVPKDYGQRTEYRLLFAGEFVGYSWTQTPNQRSVVLQCIDFSNYWDSAHATAIDYGPGGNPFMDHGALSGSNSGLFDNIVDQQPNKIVEWLKQPPQTPGLQSITGLAGGIIHMLEAMAGVPNKHRGINDFFTFAELRCRVLNQLTAEENDNTAARLVDTKVMDEWIMNGLQNMGRQVSFRDMMNLLFKYIYYESVPNPAAKFESAFKGKTEKIEGAPYALSAVPQSQTALGLINDAINWLDSSKYQLLQPQIAAQVSQVATNSLANLAEAKKSLNTISATKAELKQTLTEISNKIDQASSQLNSLKNSTATSLTAMDGPRATLQSITTTIEGATGEYRSTSYKTTSRSQLLKSHIIRPDCWFASPPRCNVIFPEHYTQFSFDRMLTGEVTRSLVQFGIKLVGPDSILDNYTLFPNNSLTGGPLTEYKGESSYRILMDHEVHTGIVPRTEWLPDTAEIGHGSSSQTNKAIDANKLSWANRAGLFSFFKYRFAPRQMQVAMRFNPFIVCGFPALLLRQPYIIPELSTPTTEVTKSLLNQVHTKAKDYRAPQHFIGMVGSVAHSLHQGGGSTQVSMHSVRRHRSDAGVDDDFLRIYIAAGKEATTKVVKTVLNIDDILRKKNVALLNMIVDCTPQTTASLPAPTQTKRSKKTVQQTYQKKTVNPKTGKIEVSQTTSNHTSTSEESASAPEQPPAFTQIGRIQGIEGEHLVPHPHGKIVQGSKKGFYGNKGTVLGVAVTKERSTRQRVGSLGRWAFEEVAIYERVPVTVDTSIPIEELLRPYWFSPKYSNFNIGPQIYQPFFGCDSIIDDLKVQGLVQTPTSNDGDKSVDATSSATDRSVDESLQLLKDQFSTVGEASAEKAVNILAFLYGRITSQGLDVDSFIRSYTNRPIATKDEVLGSDDLVLSVGSRNEAQVEKGRMGFHSAAFNNSLIENTSPLAGLVIDPDLLLPRVNNIGKTSAYYMKDIRKEKKSRVMEYITQLKADIRALRG